MEVSRLQARADDAERKLAEVPEEIAAAKTAALAKYQSLAEFEQVQTENFEEGVHTFIYNVWREHLEWDLSFLGDAAKEMIHSSMRLLRHLSLTLLQSSCLQSTSLLRSLIDPHKLSTRTLLWS